MLNSLLFNLMPADVAARLMFRYIGAAHLGAAIVILAFGGLTWLALSALLFVLVSALVNRWPRYRRTPFGLVSSFLVLVYFVGPLAFMAAMGNAYNFGQGVAQVPATSAEYAAVAPEAIVFLALMFLAGVFGLCAGGEIANPKARGVVDRMRPDLPIGLLALVVLGATLQAAELYISAKVSGESGGESLLDFIFLDSAFLMVLPIVTAVALTRGGGRSGYSRRRFAAILVLFFLQATLSSTSKGAVLTIGLLCFVAPASYFQASRSIVALIPSMKAMAIAAVLSIWMFFVAQGLRATIFTGEERTLGTFVSAVMQGGGNADLEIDLNTVGYRLSALVDRYILLYETHVTAGYSAAYAREFGTYLLKNLANQVLPGTPFVESYTPTSNLLPSVLRHDPLVGESSKAQLISSFNTQPYTSFGVAVTLGGWFAPLFIFAINLGLTLAYRWFRSVAASLAIIATYWLLLQSYGFEIALSMGLHLFVSMACFMGMLRGWVFARHLVALAIRPGEPRAAT